MFLFEELILFSKARRFPDRKVFLMHSLVQHEAKLLLLQNLDLYIYKNSIKMTDIGLTARIGESPTKFEIWFRKRKPNDTFTLQSMSEEVKRAWTEELSQLLWRQAIRNRGIKLFFPGKTVWYNCTNFSCTYGRNVFHGHRKQTLLGYKTQRGPDQRSFHKHRSIEQK